MTNKDDMNQTGSLKYQIKGGIMKTLAHMPGLRAKMPRWIKRLSKRFLPLDSYLHELYLTSAPFADAESESTYEPKYAVRLGIIKDIANYHGFYIGACREMGVPYKVVDILGPDWIEAMQHSNCDAFLIRSSVYLTIWKHLYDERLRILAYDMGKIIYPTYDELWLYESKRRMCYWLKCHHVPHPTTWIFYNIDEALFFAKTCALPIVFKTDLGAGASGVRIFSSRAPLMRFIKKCFNKGMLCRDGDPRDRQWGTVLLQEYIPNASEWRMIRIGDSYFGYEKLKRGHFHSGSHLWHYERPSDRILNFLKEVTDKGNFTSMNVDVLVSPDGRFYVSELQTLFGMGHPYEMCVVDGKPGRMVQDKQTGQWYFEAGIFCQNYMDNLRVAVLLDLLRSRGMSL